LEWIGEASWVSKVRIWGTIGVQVLRLAGRYVCISILALLSLFVLYLFSIEYTYVMYIVMQLKKRVQ